MILQKLTWQKLKKLILPLLVIKLAFSLFFVIKSDLVIITREMSDVGIYQRVMENDSIVLEKQRLFKVVKNEEDRGIIIKIRKRNSSVEQKADHNNPIVD
jgi:hypothetical protein